MNYLKMVYFIIYAFYKVNSSIIKYFKEFNILSGKTGL